MWYVIDKKLLPEVNTLKSKNINEILINELKHRFDFEKGPLIRFTLLNQTETTLIINCHHAICDGLSLMYLFKDITKILSGRIFGRNVNLKLSLLNSQKKKQQILFRNANKIMFQLIQDWLLPSYMQKNNCLSKKTIQAKLSLPII